MKEYTDLVSQEEPRPVIAKFHKFEQRDLVWSKRVDLKGSDISIHEDYPKDIKENRDKLLPISFAAKHSPQITNVSLKQDQLLINGKLYTVDNIDNVPDFLKPHNRSTIFTRDTVVFSSKHSFFSNLAVPSRHYNRWQDLQHQ